MNLPKLRYEPGPLLEFFQQGLESLGAICQRPWHDRLEVLAEGRAASAFNAEGLVERELHFVAPDATGSRDAGREVFPGAPSTFRLAEILRPASLLLDRLVLQTPAPCPTADVAAKLWHAQHPSGSQWRIDGPFARSWHFSLLALVRCEIQATDQHWSLSRIVFSLADGQLDDALASNLQFSECASAADPVPWLKADPQRWSAILASLLRDELEPQLQPIRARQQNYLRREIERIDNYFDNYIRELSQRGRRHTPEQNAKFQQRLDAAKTEHMRRRADQLQRHRVRIVTHVDALLILAEPAWSAVVIPDPRHKPMPALFVPRARRWVTEGER
ncbi:MAG: hypothetical protein L0Y58_05655 [Verrucomicrobia subdivision 3 bacterium]|nr:hypothetical protein [Limisphaerales bacterium]